MPGRPRPAVARAPTATSATRPVGRTPAGPHHPPAAPRPHRRIARLYASARAQRRGVYGDQQRERRVVNAGRRRRRVMIRTGTRLANRDAFGVSPGTAVAERRFRNVGGLEAGKADELGGLGLMNRPNAL